ncbi:hypothetical protein ACFULT_22175 [Rhodococcus sp. NPDC057297]|uniref:hypothetical protein n=1 Tax=Rhodococcus sp. NPDC057297 TaxID=3346090 RepID=UPI0036296D03
MTGRESELDPLIEFAVKWEPYGGASASEVFVEFGIGMVEYRRRLFQILSKPDRGGLNPELASRLLAYSVRPVQQVPPIGE